MMQNKKQVLEGVCRPGSGNGGCCRDCHFLMKWHRITDGGEIKMPIARDERLRLAKGDPSKSVIGDDYSIACVHGVWDSANPRKDSETNLVRVLTRDRGESCFFYPHTAGMFFPAATELEKRDADRREARRDRKVAMWSIVLGLGGVVVGAVLTKILG